ncbi:ATP-dependent protease [Thiomicrorhabdus immobilis]|uniref:endopeptidase La n=1 Tax=Thiomicrorhabdus immobilis TaxID=2791037 RepID=A0ABM7MDW4_9GAMM|nr:ATP-binding protein [Thiomicrorhabdus immobilis]BCN93590.1 ATP-dependent protease [Thiomicrorhabdus immobilis]
MKKTASNDQGQPGKYQLSNADLYHQCDLSELEFETTSDLESLTENLGQDRAMDALKFGVGMKHEGYNLFVLGSTGLGKNTTVKALLKEQAKHAQPPFDWCYVNNFEFPEKPLVLKLPKGRGKSLQQDMVQFISDLLIAIPAAFESDQYQAEYQTIHDAFVHKEDLSLQEIAAKAETNNIMMARTATGWNLGPKKEGRVLTPQEFKQLPDDEQQVITRVVEELRDELKKILLQIPLWQKEMAESVKKLNRDVSNMTVTHYAQDLQAHYADIAEVKAFLELVKQDIINNADLFRKYAAEKPPATLTANQLPPEFTEYQINVLVDNSTTEGAPVIFEDNPSYQNLIGRVEHIAHFGTLLTDFSLIKSGALHQANGGYLVLDARKVLTSLYAWDGLKRALRSHVVKIESLEQILSMASTISLKPEPIALDVKVVLTGSRVLYYLLKQFDPEFGLLFKVAADFSEDMDRDPENSFLYARMIAGLQQQNKLLALDKAAVERVIEHCSRMADDGEKVSLHMGSLVDLLKESDYWAQQAKRKGIIREDVEKAIDSRLMRSGQLRERVQESILRGIHLINTSGEKVGQINGLSVIQLDDISFGRPTRITATARLGSGKVIDIEREVELGGAIHSKGVMILSSYLAYRYAKEKPLALSASLVFEQSYGEVEGDSASAAELCVLLSAIADIPLKQSLAVTGSVNQHGEIQAIGGVNEKVEGFFELCDKRGLTGEQGVIIPASNRVHLMLSSKVLQAVKAGQFAVYSVETVDEMLSILSGVDMGVADKKGRYPKDSLNGIVEQKIQKYTELRKQYLEPKKD